MKRPVLIFLSLLLAAISCDNKFEAKDPNDTETMNSGKLTVYIDKELQGIIDAPVRMYGDDYDKVLLNIQYVTARSAMSQLLSGASRISVIARDYLPDEDSLMKRYNVREYLRLKLASDGLVFFAGKKFPSDTLNDDGLFSYLTGDGDDLGGVAAGLTDLAVFAPDRYSSVFANFSKQVLRGKPLKKKIKELPDIETVKKYVSLGSNSVGIGYLSQLVDDKDFKMLRIGYNDSLGVQITPRVVHQANIVRDFYPYRVYYYAYLQEDRNNLPFWFGTYLEREKKVQKYFLDKGIVPEFAKIKLKF